MANGQGRGARLWNYWQDEMERVVSRDSRGVRTPPQVTEEVSAREKWQAAFQAQTPHTTTQFLASTPPCRLRLFKVIRFSRNGWVSNVSLVS